VKEGGGVLKKKLQELWKRKPGSKRRARRSKVLGYASLKGGSEGESERGRRGRASQEGVGKKQQPVNGVQWGSALRRVMTSS